MTSRIDWERIEPIWRAGLKSVLQIAAEYHEETGQTVSHTAINKHFRKLGVPRDLKAKVLAKAEAMVSAAQVSGLVSTETTETDAKIIDVNATNLASIRMSQRKDITRSRKLVMSLLTELEAQTDSQGLMLQLAELLHGSPDDSTAKQIADQEKRQEAFSKVISLNSRVGTMKSLADSLKTLVALEREAFGIDDRVKPPDEVPTTYNMKF